MDLFLIILLFGLIKAFLFSREKLDFSLKKPREVSLFFSLPFLFFLVVFVFIWPGTINKPFISGSLKIISGGALLFFSFLVIENSRFSEAYINWDDSRIVIPPEFLPLFAKWDFIEDILTSLFLSLLISPEIRKNNFFIEVILIFSSLILFNLPLLAKIALLPWFDKRKNEMGSIKQRLWRFVIGLIYAFVVIFSFHIIYSGILVVASTY